MPQDVRVPRRGQPQQPSELSAALLADEVARRGLPVRWVHHAYFRTSVDGVVVGFWCARTNVVSAVADMTTQRKDLTHGLLLDAGFRVAAQAVYHVDELDRAVDEAFELAPKLVVKPARGRRGSGVTLGVVTREQLEAAWRIAVETDPVRIVLEEQVVGREIRFLVVAGESIAAVEKRPPRVVGDGHRSIAQLVAAVNEARAVNRHLRDWPLELDATRLSQLHERGHDVSSVLAPGQVVELDDLASLSSGGSSHDVTDEVDASYHELAGQVARSFPGLGIAGVDLIVGHPERPVGDYVVLEVNSMPGLGLHHYPLEGRSRDVASAIVEATLDSVQ